MDSKNLLEDSKVFCIAPWTHLHVLTTGKVFPCCMSGHETDNAVGDLQAGDTLESAWNSPRMRALRLDMLAGRSSKLCERCYTNEDLGIESFRQSENKQMAHHVRWVEQTKADGGLDSLHLPYLDLRLSNLCNLKCRICCHKYSTSWYGDAVKLGLLAPGSPREIDAVEGDDRLWNEIAPLIPALEHVHFAGGEPLIMPEHYRLLAELISLGRTDVRISYNTNFLVLHYKASDVMSMWKHFPVVYVSASLDGMGARGDYMRKGQRWDRIEENRARLLRECPHVDFQVAATVSLMNVLQMPAFFRDWYEKGFVKLDRMKMFLLFEPEYYSVQGLPSDLKRRVEDLYGEFIETYLTPLGEEATELITNFRAIVTHMRERDLDIAPEFRRVTVELDVVRGESFAQTFPELADFGAPTLVERARAHGKLSDTARSRRDYDEAIRLDPGNADAHAERGLVRQRSGDASGALADFERALELEPEHVQARLNRGILLRERGEPAAARWDLDVVLERMDELCAGGKQRPHVHIERGRIRRLCGDFAGAVEEFDQALALVSRGDAGVRRLMPLILSERGVVRQALGDHLGSWRDFTQAVVLGPPDQVAYLEGAIVSFEQRGTSPPVSSSNTLDPAHPATHALLYYARGVARRQRGEWDLAMPDFDRALQLLPPESAPLLQLVDRMRRPECDPLNPFAE